MKCPACQLDNREGAKFCKRCGTKLERLYQEVRLQDLSPSEAEEMMESLLKTDAIPAELRRFIQEKVEGNPFYLEEVMNSLIEAEMGAKALLGQAFLDLGLLHGQRGEKKKPGNASLRRLMPLNNARLTCI